MKNSSDDYLCILLTVPLQSVYIMIRNFLIYLRDPNRFDARYLLGWNVCTIIAMIFITGEIEVEGKPAWMTAGLSPWGWVVYNVFLNIGVLGMIYHGVGFSMVLTGENTKNLRRCYFFLGLTLFDTLGYSLSSRGDASFLSTLWLSFSSRQLGVYCSVTFTSQMD